MLTTLLLIACSQFNGLSMWTDAAGVVHVAAKSQAPSGATPLEGGSYSVVDGDGRPLVMSDGGTRADDSRWWRARFSEARETLKIAQELERSAERSTLVPPVCVTATAQAASSVRVFSRSATVVAASTSQGGPVLLQVPPRGAVQVTDRKEERVTRCEEGRPSEAALDMLRGRREQRALAERALRQLELEALSKSVPVRDRY